jgi:hypothetical protein
MAPQEKSRTWMTLSHRGRDPPRAEFHASRGLCSAATVLNLLSDVTTIADPDYVAGNAANAARILRAFSFAASSETATYPTLAANRSACPT